MTSTSDSSPIAPPQSKSTTTITPRHAEASHAKRGEIFQQIIARVSALPGVEAAGISDYLPLGPNREWDTPVPKGKVFAPGELPDPLVYVITPGFIRAMGIRMHGRDFTWADGPQSERVVLINASAARVYWPGEDAVGKILMRGQRRRPRGRGGGRRPRRNSGGRNRIANLLSGNAADAGRRAIGGPHQPAACGAGGESSFARCAN